VIRQQEVATSHLLEKGDWDLLFSVIQAPDPIQHKFWNVLDATDPRYDAAKAREHLPALEESYRRCDEVIGDRLAMAERGDVVMVVSDHGFGRYEKNVLPEPPCSSSTGCCRARRAPRRWRRSSSRRGR
jgi:predicted AlkP superfamily phosphohydrolase/phosphomutase